MIVRVGRKIVYKISTNQKSDKKKCLQIEKYHVKLFDSTIIYGFQ